MIGQEKKTWLSKQYNICAYVAYTIHIYISNWERKECPWSFANNFIAFLDSEKLWHADSTPPPSKIWIFSSIKIYITYNLFSILLYISKIFPLYKYNHVIYLQYTHERLALTTYEQFWFALFNMSIPLGSDMYRRQFHLHTLYVYCTL